MKSNFNIDKCNGDGVCSEIMEKIAYTEADEKTIKENLDLKMLSGDYLPAPLHWKMLEKYKGKCKWFPIRGDRWKSSLSYYAIWR